MGVRIAWIGLVKRIKCKIPSKIPSKIDPDSNCQQILTINAVAVS